MLRAFNDLFYTKPPDVIVKNKEMQYEIVEAKNESGETVYLEMLVQPRVHDPLRATNNHATRTHGTQ